MDFALFTIRAKIYGFEVGVFNSHSAGICVREASKRWVAHLDLRFTTIPLTYSFHFHNIADIGHVKNPHL